MLNSATIGIWSLVGAMAFSATSADAIEVDLSGTQEVPAVITRGEAGATIERHPGSLLVGLRWRLEGEITQAHMHLGQRGANGGVVAFLCANPAFILVPPPPPLTPECEGNTGHLEVTLIGDDVIGPADQGIEAGQTRKAKQALRQGLLYLNVHSEKFPGGEVRGQIDQNDGDDGLEERIEELEERLNEHSHIYLTGKGKGHNKIPASTSAAEF